MNDLGVFVYLLHFALFALTLGFGGPWMGRKSLNTACKAGDRPLGKKGATTEDCVVLEGNAGRAIKYALETMGENGPVRTLRERAGEVANLPDPWENSRSKAAILAKKYFEHSQRLRNIYNASQKRELNQEEVAAVFAFWESWKNGNSEGTGNPWESPFTDELAGGGGGDDGAVDPVGGCPRFEDADEGDGDERHDGDLARCMAGSEEGEGDSCL